MKRLSSLLLMSLSLCGCQSATERMARMESDDDQACRKIIADRRDARPDAYTQCRANFQQYRQQMAVAESGTTVVVAPSGPPRHWSLD